MNFKSLEYIGEIRLKNFSCSIALFLLFFENALKSAIKIKITEVIVKILLLLNRFIIENSNSKNYEVSS